MIAKKEVSLDHYFCDICGAPIGPVKMIPSLDTCSIDFKVSQVNFRQRSDGSMEKIGSGGPLQGTIHIILCDNCLKSFYKRYHYLKGRRFEDDVNRIKDVFIEKLRLFIKEDDTNA